MNLRSLLKPCDNYFEYKAISSSFIKACINSIKNKGVLEKFKTPDSLSLFIGSEIHLALETKGESLKDLIVIPDELLNISKSEYNVITSNLDFPHCYLSVYNDSNCKKLKPYFNDVITSSYEELSSELKKCYDKITINYSEIIEKGKPLLDFLEKHKDKKIINNLGYSKKDYETIVESYESVVNSDVYFLLFDGDELYSEFSILHEIENIEYKILIDRIVINNEKKTINLFDYKSFSFSLLKNYKSLKYYLQFSFYFNIFKDAIKNTHYKDYTINFFIIGIDTINKYSKCFLVSENDLKEGINKRCLLPRPIIINNEIRTICKNDEEEILISSLQVYKEDEQFYSTDVFNFIKKYELYKKILE